MTQYRAHILYMEDDEMTAELVCVYLEGEGYAMEHALNGRLGMEQLRAAQASDNPFDLVLLDYEMPEMNGLDVLEEMRTNGPAIPAIMASAVGDRNVVIQAMRYGADDYIVKQGPGTFLEFLAVSIERSLNQKRRKQEHQEAIKNLAVSEERYRRLVEANPLSIAELDPQGHILSINSAGRKMLGWSEQADHSNAVYSDHSCSQDRDILNDAIERALHGMEQRDIEYSIGDNADPGYLSVSFVPLSDQRTSIMAITADITERRQLQDRLTHMAQHDLLTGLPNRNLLYDQLGMAIARAHRQSKLVAFLYVDLDNFKGINEEYGYTIGDMVLAEVADRLRKDVRETDIVARMGDDQMGLVLSDLTSTEGVERVAKQVLDQLAEPYQLGELRINTTCSIGIAMYPQHGDTQERLIRKADDAMGVAKRAGKNDFRFARG